MSVKVALDPERLYVLIDRVRRHDHVSFRDIARETGISPSTFTRLGRGRTCDADALLTLLRWLSIDPSEVWKDEEEKP